MNTSESKRNLRPLEIAIGILCLIWTIWALFITGLLIDSTDLWLSKYMELEGAFGSFFRTSMKVFTYLSYLINPLLLLWFILMRKQLRKGTATIAIIGLSVATTLGIISTIINYVYPLTYDNLTNPRLVLINVSAIIEHVSILLVGIAYILMNRQINKSLGSWAICIGVSMIVGIVFGLFSLFNSYVLIHLYPIQHFPTISKAINITTEVVTVFKFFSLTVFYFLFARSERKTIWQKP